MIGMLVAIRTPSNTPRGQASGINNIFQPTPIEYRFNHIERKSMAESDNRHFSGGRRKLLRLLRIVQQRVLG